MNYTVSMRPTAERDFDKLPHEAMARVAKALRQLTESPRPPGAEALKGPLRGKIRIRAGDWRVAYEVDDKERTVWVVEIGHRDKVYDRAKRRQ